MDKDINNLLSKKLLATETTIFAVVYLAKDVPDKLPYCILIVVIAVIYKICQVVLDWKGK